MQPVLVAREVTSRGSMASGMFGLSVGNEAHIFGVLRNTLYANKELAVLREYSTNAWDAHVDAGIPDRPIKIVLPTDLAPTLVIRDYGKGLSEEDVFGIYTQYGASTKRGTNDTVGFLGIGSKSAFAYSDTFTITSFHGGLKSVYVAVIDETNVGKVEKKHEEPLAEGEETGVEIRVPVDPKDIPAFHREAAFLYPYFHPLPDVNLPLEAHNVQRRENGYILDTADEENDSRRSRWLAVMGCVPYRLDFSKMAVELQTAGLDKLVDKIQGVLQFSIGEISVSASREEIEYTARTKEATVLRLRLLLDELMADVERVVSDPSSTAWQRRLAVLEFHRTTKLPIPSKYLDWGSDQVNLYDHRQLFDGDGNAKVDGNGRPVTNAPRTYRMYGFRFKKYHYGFSHHARVSKMMEWHVVEVEPDTCLFLRDTDKALRGYHLKQHDRVIVPESGCSDHEVLAELQQHIEQAGLTGILIRRLSELPHDADAVEEPEERPSITRAYNEKHVQKHFVLRDLVNDSTPLSANWDIVTRTPTKRDVFVILSRFEVLGIPSFYRRVKRDRIIFSVLGGKFPPIYGYKSTEREPIDATQVRGVPYQTWRDAEVDRLLTAKPDVRAKLEDHRWAKLFDRMFSYYGPPIATILSNIQPRLPDGHPLVFLFTRHHEAVDREAKISKADMAALVTLFEDAGQVSWEADRHLTSIFERYPLLRPENGGTGLKVFSDPEKSPHWTNYINLIDRVTT